MDVFVGYYWNLRDCNRIRRVVYRELSMFWISIRLASSLPLPSTTTSILDNGTWKEAYPAERACYGQALRELSQVVCRGVKFLPEISIIVHDWHAGRNLYVICFFADPPWRLNFHPWSKWFLHVRIEVRIITADCSFSPMWHTRWGVPEALLHKSTYPELTGFIKN